MSGVLYQWHIPLFFLAATLAIAFVALLVVIAFSAGAVAFTAVCTSAFFAGTAVAAACSLCFMCGLIAGKSYRAEQ